MSEIPGKPSLETVRYRSSGPGSISIKLMMGGLIVGTGWFAYTLSLRGRLPWQHGVVKEMVEEKLEKLRPA